MARKTGDEFRAEMAWRSSFETDGRWGIPLVRRQGLVDCEIGLIAYPDTRTHDVEANTWRGVHFFVDDPRFEGIYRNPGSTLEKLSQYRFLLTPDNSV